MNSVGVTELLRTTIHPKCYLFTALVWHSQTVSAPALRVWVGVKESVEVICAFVHTVHAWLMLGTFVHM